MLFGGALATFLAVLPMTVRAADADLQIAFPAADAKGAPPTDFHYGETLTYTAIITNLGPGDATRVQITSIDVPAPLVLKAVSGCTPPAGATDPVPCTVGTDGTIFNQPDPAQPKLTATVTFDVELPMPEAGLPTTCPDGSGLSAVSITVGTDTASGGTTDPVPANNTVTSPVPKIGTFTDLGITMTAPATASIGDTIDVTATIVNNGPCPATEVMADDEQAVTSLLLGFVSAEGDCTEDPLNGTCEWASLVVDETKTWTIHYKVLDLPPTVMQAGYPASLTVFRNPDAADPDPIDVNPDNDVGSTQTVVKKSVGAGCNTGGMGGALGLLVLAVPFLRRRRRS